MKRSLVGAPLPVVATLFLTASAAFADQWIQIEAQPTLTEATESARGYAARFPNVVGFDLPGRWHAIALGPYATAEEADAARLALRAQGLIPGDAYLTEGERFGRPFWPVGASLSDLAQSATPPAVSEQPLSDAPGAEGTELAALPAAELPAPEPEETPAEARASERLLDRPAREALQTALGFAGFYTSTVDGAFGPGTRNAMAAWQSANGYEPTGVLTTRQRGLVLSAYREVVDSLGLAPVTDDVAGISVTLPMGLVEFDEYAPPFAKYGSADDSGVQVLLISQSGDGATLGGLYEIMQTLEIVPLEGERARDADSFVLTGANANVVTHAEARLAGGAVKGWVLIWPRGDEQRRTLALDALRTSFAPTTGVLPDAYGEGAEQDIDLLAGLEIRRPDRAGSGFYVDGEGRVLTASDLVQECARITLDETYEATVSAQEDGMALLTPADPLAPVAVARFDGRLPRLQSEVSVSGYAYEGRLGAPTLNYGTVAEQRGLAGEEDVLRLAMTTVPGEAGGPLLSTSGAVIGMLASDGALAGEDGRTLPEGVAFAYDMEKLATFLSANGVTVTGSEEVSGVADTDLLRLGRDLTVLVSCWN
ncbi:trypsin-like peptidase domain-containing protein [Celeribacter indicus]|uniref:Peptidoglycan binding-like domain-containing protein n=1 Tax=Celeribacter indicus TaxID=1208324 RepID=A0A0B5E5E8_9RHOB|nr:trypsin-like peptidase domain-containing protein [Celeribacter indicus]AJE48196.1 hypothetical protein P73_3481 [Celeribacter indicus]SDW69167.1 Putative peptidoglycan binding domain-containing protein [Celeribacter indicus]